MTAARAGDNRARITELLAGRPKPRVRRDGPIGGQPGVDGTVGNIHVEAPTQDGSSGGDGVAGVEGGDGIENEFEGIGSILAGFCGKTVQAFRALEELQGSQAVSALASSCSRLAVALRTRRI